MDYVFIISYLTPVGIKSTRTANPVLAFARAHHFPSAIVCWDVNGDEAQSYTGPVGQLNLLETIPFALGADEFGKRWEMVPFGIIHVG